MNLLIPAVYFLILIIIGIYSHSRNQTDEGYFLASRSLGIIKLTSTLAATTIGGSAVILVIGQVYANGLPFIWADIAGGLGLILLGVLLAGKVRETGSFSLPEIAGQQYGSSMRLISSILVVIAELGFLALLLRACVGIVQPFFGFPSELTVLVIAVFFIVYTIIGGQLAIAHTDIFQLILSFGGLGLLLFLLLHGDRSFELPATHLDFPFSQEYPPINITTLILITGLPHLVGSDIFGKLLCAKDAKTARAGAMYAGLLKIIAGVFAGLIGLYAVTSLGSGFAADTVVSELLLNLAHPLVAAIIVTGLLATLMSSADSVLLTAATVVSRDILPKRVGSSAMTGRLVTLFFGIAGIALTLLFPTMLSAFLFAYTLFSGAIVVPVLLGFWKERLHLTSMGALSGMVSSALLIIVLSTLGFASSLVTISGILCNAVLLFSVSWFQTLSRRKSS